MVKEIRLVPWRMNPILPTVFSDSLTEIENIGALVEKLNELISDYNEFIAHYKEYIAEQLAPFTNRLNMLETQLNGLITVVNGQLQEMEAFVNKNVADLTDYVDGQVDALKNDVTDMIDKQNAKFEKTITELEAEMDNLNEYLVNYVENSLLRIKSDVTALMSEQVRLLRELIDTHDEQTRLWCEARLQQFLSELPTNQVYVINPITNKSDTLQNTLYMLYEMQRTDALTAFEYDSLELTAEEYDDKGLTAWGYDNYAKQTLYPDPRWYMFDPFTGHYVPVKYVVDELADLHKEGTALTAEGYDGLELTSQGYDDKGLTAYEYDWTGKLLLQAA